MDHEGASHIHDGLYGSLGTPVLMLSAHARKSLALLLGIAVLAKLGGRENAIIPVVVLDIGTCMLEEPFFKMKFGVKSVSDTKRDLIFD